MSSESRPVEDTAMYLAVQASTPILSDDLWKDFGYPRRPRRGKSFDRFMDKDELAVEHFIVREITALAFLDILAAVKEALPSKDDQMLVLVRTSLQLCGTMDEVFDGESYFDYLVGAIQSYRKSENPHGTMMSRASKIFDIRKFPQFVAGVVPLIAVYVASTSAGVRTFVLDRKLLKAYLASRVPMIGKLAGDAPAAVAGKHIRFFYGEVSEKGAA